MKALSFKQPWAELILERRKTIDIRSWNTKFRGEFLIHASKNPDLNAINYYKMKLENLKFGFLVGIAKLVDVIIYNSKEEFFRDKDKHLSITLPNKFPVYGFILKEVRRIKPIKCKGALGFFNVKI